MTDGWYPVRAILDKPLSSLLQSNKIRIGTKLCIYGANLTGSDQAAPPLEVSLLSVPCFGDFALEFFKTLVITIKRDIAIHDHS